MQDGLNVSASVQDAVDVGSRTLDRIGTNILYNDLCFAIVRIDQGLAGGRDIADQFRGVSLQVTDGFDGTYLELVPNERVVDTGIFDDPNLPGILRRPPVGGTPGSSYLIKALI